MPSPSTAVVRLDLSMTFTEFNERINQLGFIGGKVLPPRLVAKPVSKFLKMQTEFFLGPVPDTKRAPNGTYRSDDEQFTQDDYATEQHGHEGRVGDYDQNVYGSEINLFQAVTRRQVNNCLMSYEAAAAAAVFNTTTWTGASLTTAVSVPWTTHATATPIDDLEAAIQKVDENSGLPANTIILPYKGWRHFRRCAQVTDLLKYWGGDDPKALGAIGALKEHFQVDNVYIPRGTKNTKEQGLSKSFSRFWDPTMAMVCHVRGDQSGSEGPLVGWTPMYSDENVSLPGDLSNESALIIEQYYDDTKRSTKIRCRWDWGLKIQMAAAGHLLTAVTA